MTDRQTDRQTDCVDHDSMMSVWSECLSLVHLPHKCEPRDRYTHSNNRPDILVYDSETGSNAELDVALAYPWASDILPRAATTGEARQ